MKNKLGFANKMIKGMMGFGVPPIYIVPQPKDSESKDAPKSNKIQFNK